MGRFTALDGSSKLLVVLTTPVLTACAVLTGPLLVLHVRKRKSGVLYIQVALGMQIIALDQALALDKWHSLSNRSEHRGATALTAR